MRAIAASCAIVLAVLPAVAMANPNRDPSPGAERQAARVESGRRLFQRCAGCHAVGPNAANGFGPQLNGVIGRKAGSVPGYAYSPALRASTLVWDERTLAAFIRDSDKVIPGNKMRFFSFMSEKQALEIVAFLAASAPPSGVKAGASRP